MATLNYYRIRMCFRKSSSGLQHLLDRDLHRIAEGRKIVPAFEDKDHGDVSAGQDAPDDAVDPFVGHPDIRMRVVRMDVVAGGHKDDVRPETLHYAGQDVLVHGEVILVARAREDRHIVGIAHTLSRATLHVPAGFGIEGILVGAEVENRVVLFEDMLRAVPVMCVEVNNEDLLISDPLRVPGTDSHVVEEAEPHGPVCFGVVPRRPDRAEYPAHPVVPTLLHGFHHRAGSEERRLIAAQGRERIGIHRACSDATNTLNVLSRVHAFHLVLPCGARP